MTRQEPRRRCGQQCVLCRRSPVVLEGGLCRSRLRLLRLRTRNIDRGEPANDGESGDLWLGREPDLDRSQMWIELRGQP
jgi:hypothetical protein